MSDSQTCKMEVVERLGSLIDTARRQVEGFEEAAREFGDDRTINAFDIAETAGSLAFRKAYLVTIESFVADVQIGRDTDVAYSTGMSHAYDAGLPQTMNPMEIAIRNRQQQGMLAALREIHDLMRRVRLEFDKRDDS
ncbi:hypothetical protein [Aeromicrobium sp. 179-A 4D2 NHS]|uniref:hypothetical protein n=1 Tax=Aeromicrobium sp. 179-A 4D2 NHS TaxID=3142375 RepID=UPI00399EFEF6